MSLFGIGTMIYVALLLINAMAILSEDRFLARIGWVSASRQIRDVNTGFQQTYDHTNAYGTVQGEAGMKARLIDLISAVRTLMRIPLIVINTVVILYELAWG
ncbi:Protein transport protein yos1 [Psilocybe cubensis]|uniref:Yos1-like protein n=2 Tax=Psilocybe cubensis TaxID=181762 RepID=A0A8H7Y1D5_PSICU|nr:Protein transport protein yos1 [Psilocybe cubensis]KAH9482640.1 Protein transport protein yos1 [Psilocybe cubensis]